MRYKSLVPFILILSTIVSPIFSGCGGGGGGDSRRTRDTALRLIHANIGIAPLEVRVAEPILQKAAYAEVTNFAQVQSGPTSIQLRRANSPEPGAFATLSQTLEDNTEYSIFVVGGSNLGADQTKLLAEPVTEVQPGFARVQLLNGLDSSSALTLLGGGVPTDNRARYGESSGFFEIAIGPKNFSVEDSEGRVVATVETVLEDQSEATIVISGSRELGTVFSRVYLDFD